jgi:hypothetical protein
MRLTASALTVLFTFFALTSSVLAQSDVVGREVDSDSNDYPKHKVGKFFLLLKYAIPSRSSKY